LNSVHKFICNDLIVVVVHVVIFVFKNSHFINAEFRQRQRRTPNHTTGLSLIGLLLVWHNTYPLAGFV